MDAAHALFQPIGVPRNVVVEHDVAALEIDALASGLRCDEHLDCALTKLLFRVEPAPLHITRTDLHPPVDEANFETPVGELADEIVEVSLNSVKISSRSPESSKNPCSFKTCLSFASFASPSASSKAPARLASSSRSAISSRTS